MSCCVLQNDCEDEDRDIPPPDYDVDQSPGKVIVNQNQCVAVSDEPSLYVRI